MSRPIDTIDDLLPDDRNARIHNERNLAMIQQSLQEVGAARSIVIDDEGKVLAGNGVVQAAGKAGIHRVQVVEADGDAIIAVRRRGLTDEQKRRLALWDNRTGELSEWDVQQILADVDAGQSFEGMFSDWELNQMLQGLTEHPDDAGGEDDYGPTEGYGQPGAGGQAATGAGPAQPGAAGSGPDEPGPYTRKVESPVYVPTGPCPSVGELYDDSRTRQLVQQIQAAEGLTDEQRQFLTIAAQRHTVINYHAVAEFYAHADAGLQELMENSALVIIDFNRAIELGFVQMTKALAEQVQAEYGDD